MKGRPLLWRELHITAPLPTDRARAALVALASLPGSPRLVLEAIGQGARVQWRVGAEPYAMTAVLAALQAHLPDLRVTLVRAATGDLAAGALSTAASVHLPGSEHLPLRHDAGEAVTRQLLAAIAAAGNDELVRVQLIVGPRLRPRRIRDIDPVNRRAVTTKLGEHGFGCCYRVAARAATTTRAHQLVEQIAAALRGLEVPAVTVRLRRTSPRSVALAASPWFWPLWLRVSDLVPLTGWPTADLPLPGVPSPHPRQLPASADLATRGRVIGESTLDPHRAVALDGDDALRHLHLIGPTGTGKSTLLANLALQDIASGHGVVVIDPKGDLIDQIAARLPEARLDDVVILDAREDRVVGLDSLGARSGDPDLAADILLGVFHSLYADAWGPRTQDILHACLLTLARRGDACLAMVPLLLTNPGFRRSVTGRVVKADPLGLGSFWAWYDALSDAERAAAIAPLMNKLRTVLMRPTIRAMLGQTDPRLAMSDVFRQRRVLLVSLAKGVIGAEAAQVLGSLVVSLLWQAALSRTAIDTAQRRPVFVHIDEVQDYLRLPGDLGDALTQARGLGVGFTLAHQHLGQLPAGLRAALLANARSRVAFSLGPDDARQLAPVLGAGLVADDLRSLPAFQAYAQVLVRGTTAPTASIRTHPLPAALRSAATVRARSARRYGQPVAEVDALLSGYAVTAPDRRHTATHRPDAPIGRRPRPGQGGVA